MLRPTLSVYETVLSRTYAKDENIVVKVVDWKKRERKGLQILDSQPQEMDYTIKTDIFSWSV